MIRLLELRTEKELSQRDVAKKLFISQGTYNNWENGKTQPSIEQLILLSKLFDVSIDYIVGNTNDTEIVSPIKPDKKVICNEIIQKIHSELEDLSQIIK